MNTTFRILAVLLLCMAAFIIGVNLSSAANAQEPDRFILFSEGDLEQVLVLDPDSRDSCGILIHEPGTAKIPAGNKLIITGTFSFMDQAPMFSVSMVATQAMPRPGPLDAEVNFIDEDNNVTQPWVFHSNVSPVPGGVIIHTETSVQELDAFLMDMMEHPFVTLGQGSNMHYKWSTEWAEEGIYAFFDCMERIQPALGDDL